MTTQLDSTNASDLPGGTRSENRENAAARRLLLWLLLGYVLLYLAAAMLLAQRAIAIATIKGIPFEASDLIVFGFAYTLLFNLLTTLPLLMVVGYRGLQGPMLKEQVRGSLTLCGLPLQQVYAGMGEYTERNGFRAFLLPIGVNLGFLVILWGAVLFPYGIGGLMDHMTTNGLLQVSLDRVLKHVAAEALVGNWVFLGAYFYALTTMVRRWMQSDLTANVLWKLNTRFAVTVLVGLLFTALFSDAGSARYTPEAWVISLAFVAGLVPDVFLRWVVQQSKRLIGGDDTAAGLFSPSDLQRKLTGMSFWQADRLAEEGIESVQDMAMHEIPDLLIRTRFDPALLFSWVDRALLWNQAGTHTLWLEHANLRSASQLVFRVKHGDAPERAFGEILTSLQDARTRTRQQLVNMAVGNRLTKDPPHGEQGQPMRLSRALLDNIVSGLEHAPNLAYVSNYRQQARLVYRQNGPRPVPPHPTHPVSRSATDTVSPRTLSRPAENASMTASKDHL